MRRVIGRNFGRIEIGANHTFRWAGLFDLGDDAGLLRRMFGADCADKIAQITVGLGFSADGDKRDGFLRGSDFFELGRPDFFQDVGHGGFSLGRQNLAYRGLIISRDL